MSTGSDLVNLDELASTVAELLSSGATRVLPKQVLAAVKLLQDGNTLPFIARYRKEATAGLDENQLREIEDRLQKAEELAARKKTVLKSLSDQNVLTDELERQIQLCSDRQMLEDLYAPFRPKRKTRAAAAREKGLQPLADILLQQRSTAVSVDRWLDQYVNAAKGVSSANEALSGACDIVAETWADDPANRRWMQERAQRGRVAAKLKRGKKADSEKYEQWIGHSENVSRMPSHRFLALKRGEADGVLKVSVDVDDDWALPRLKERLVKNPGFELADVLTATVEDCYRRLLVPQAESAVLQSLKQKADAEAIAVFADNVRELLLAPPAGHQVTLGIDPGFRTGCKLAVVDETGSFLENATIYPTAPRNDTVQAEQILLKLLKKHDCRLIAIGNGTASRETESFVASVIRTHDLQVTKVIVSEAGASVYSASELAAKEYPDLDVTVRGAISIAHRLQDPLAELVKIDPRAIGVGQYQHDVDQTALRRSLDREVQSCVNSVGVDVNLASEALLSYVAGIGPAIAANIVAYRKEHGRFRNRRQLLKIPKLGPKAYEQAAGFLRISDGDDPLDRSGVHPESYDIVNRMAQILKTTPEQLVGNADRVDQIDPTELADGVGTFTLQDIIDELKSPGRDPREEFQSVSFREDVREVSDLKPGMKLEGVITNVTHFGAFCDIGVHQDGLIHISQLANHFVEDPAKEVKVGQIVSVTVLEIDEHRKRISLSRKAVTS